MSDASSARTRRTYDEIAPEFLARSLDRTQLAQEHDRFAARLPPGALVLDVGAGPGVDSAELRRRGLRVVSVDLSLGMLRVARRELPGLRVQADMGELPFARAARGCWMMASLLHVERPRVPRVLAGLRRVLLPPGVLHLAVKRGEHDGWDTSRYGPAHPRWFTYWLPAELDRTLAEAGFRIERADERAGARDVWLSRLCTI